MDIAQLKALNELNKNNAAAGGVAKESGQAQGPSFKEVLGNVIDEVNTLQHKAGESIESLATGKVEDLHEVMIAMAKAEVSFKFMLETRNKLLEAYKEVMRLQM